MVYIDLIINDDDDIVDKESQDGVSNLDIDDISEDDSGNQIIVLTNYRIEG